MPRAKNLELREFILRNIPNHSTNIAPVAAVRFKISRASVGNYLKALIKEGLVEATGKTNGRRYELARLDFFEDVIAITPGLQEDLVLREKILPFLKPLPSNIVAICEYGFGEMMNNVIDHSEAKHCVIRFQRNYAEISLELWDNGVGIFDKITRECHLANPHEAILELSKGKLTTDASKHTGEGIFFTSRMFDRFGILSGELYYTRRRREDDEWLVESETRDDRTEGTLVRMRISTDATQTTKEAFDKYLDDDYRFARTHVPLILAKYEGENLVSRSQARRLLTRVERFSEVMLDFRGISEIGQAFADEIFRVWAREHPSVRVLSMNMSPEVERMTKHALVNAADQKALEEQPSLPLGEPPKASG
jgi:anti-sigma regulatory factor (Ser/Thr protein kinase)